jgi:molybdenum cofactor cytidylyltransferase
MKVSGVILAAGRSTRLGRPKQLLLLEGEPIIRITTSNAVASRLAEVVLVLGSEADAVSASVGSLGQRNILNPDFASGQSTSLKTGLAAVSVDADGVMFLLGDQPEVGPEVIDPLISAFDQNSAPIVQAVYGGIPSNPVLFARLLFDELATVTGDEGARSVVRKHATDILRVSVSDGPPPGDVDTEADFEALLDRWASREPASPRTKSPGLSDGSPCGTGDHPRP